MERKQTERQASATLASHLYHGSIFINKTVGWVRLLDSICLIGGRVLGGLICMQQLHTKYHVQVQCCRVNVCAIHQTLRWAYEESSRPVSRVSSFPFGSDFPLLQDIGIVVKSLRGTTFSGEIDNSSHFLVTQKTDILIVPSGNIKNKEKESTNFQVPDDPACPSVSMRQSLPTQCFGSICISVRVLIQDLHLLYI